MFSIDFTLITLLISGITILLYFRNINLSNKIKNEQEAEKQKQSFLATLVHDLKTPTNAQINTLKLLKSGTFGQLTTEQYHMIELTHDSCRYMSDLISTIMETYNCDYGNVNLQKSEFDISELIIELCESVKTLAMYNHQQIKFTMNQSCTIYADKLQIKRVLQNLLSNAITYGFKNTTIEIILKTNKNSIEISVKNISKQIPQNELATIFDKFKKTNFSNFNKAGTGLGLYLSKQIVNLHNGKIYAESLDDGTCIFGFRIPAATKINDNKFCYTTP